MIIDEYVKAILRDNNEVKIVSEGVSLNASVLGISYDSRRCKSGDVFFCKGRDFKTEYLLSACRNGAAAVFFESFGDTDVRDVVSDFPECVFASVSDVRRAMAVCSALHYGHSFKKLTTVAVTGTKGKTSTVWLIRNILSEMSGVRAAVLSETVSESAPRLTTPESPDLHEALYRASESGITHVICEISSQAMAEKRCYGIEFDYGCFLNLGRDHVSKTEHKSEKEYLKAKASLFTQCKSCVLNLDCKNTPFITALLKKERPSADVTFFSFENGRADFLGGAPKLTEEGCTFEVTDSFGTKQTVCISTHGTFNAENALAAYSVCSLLGADKRSLFNGILCTRVGGRGEELETLDGKVKVIVDYAHNEMSFRALFEDIRLRYGEKCKITAVFGCPGEKADERRRQLPSVASKYADRIIICEDDSGKEPFESIKNDILTSLSDYSGVSVIKDRAEAIRRALLSVFENKEERIIVFAGKGRETKMRTEKGDIDCASDHELATRAVSEYNSRLSTEAIFSSISAHRGELMTAIVEGGTDVAESLAFSASLFLKNGVSCLTFCSKRDADEITRACFTYGVVCEEIENLDETAVKAICQRGAIALFTANEADPRSGAKVAVELKSDLLVYLSKHGGILLNGRIPIPKLSVSSAELITPGNEYAYLPEMIYAARNGIKSCAVVDGRVKNALPLFLSSAPFSGTALSL